MPGLVELCNIGPKALILRSRYDLILLDPAVGLPAFSCVDELLFLQNIIQLFVDFLVFLVVFALDFLQQISNIITKCTYALF